MGLRLAAPAQGGRAFRLDRDHADAGHLPLEHLANTSDRTARPHAADEGIETAEEIVVKGTIAYRNVYPAVMALMTALPGLTVLVPADVVEAGKAIWAAGTTDGPFYIRVGRPKLQVLYDESHEFEIGKAHQLRDGTDVTVIACGLLVAAAVEAAEALAGDGLSVRVLNMSTIKPLDDEAILRAARETGAIVTAEEHNVIGGLGSAVARTLALQAPTPVEMVGVQDRFGESGTWKQLLERHGLNAAGISDAVRRVVARK